MEVVAREQPGPPAVELHEVSRVHASAAGQVVALGPVSLEIASGELVALMGPSGSGKSTLLSLAGALDQPTAGTVRVGGVDLSALSAKRLADLRRRSIGIVFQEFNLLPGLTAAENVALPLELDGVRVGAARELALAALDDVGLRALAQRFPDDLSGGERQRVAIARAFVGPRELLLADEPTGALDSVTGEQVMRSLREQCDRGRTALLATHNAAHASWADRVLFLRDGLLVEDEEHVERASVL